MAFEDLRGKSGTVVMSKSRSGLVVRPRVKSKNPRTPAQQAIRSYMSKAAATFKGLTTAQVAQWQAYAQTIVKHNPVNNHPYSPTAITAFTGLATKFLQNNPSGTIPVTPPASAFAGDTVVVTATAATGKVTFTGSKANLSGVTTEFLLQPLKSRNRTPNSRGYRSKAFGVFALGSLSFDVLVPSGYYAAAYRFVNTATGQESILTPLTVVQVALSVADGGKVMSQKAA